MNSLLELFRYWCHTESVYWSGYVKSFLKKKNNKNLFEEPVDFVVTWVDGNDPEWKREKENYLPFDKKGNGNARYREWGHFLYWFRAVERYAPWVRKIHLVTWGHLPSWLNTEHPKLNIVKHSDFIPREYLPTYNSTVIEMNLHRIEGLSEYFIYFNDDMYLSKPVLPKDFFFNGLPKYCAIAYPLRNYRYNGPFVHQQLSAVGMVNGCFNFSESVEKNPELWFNRNYGYDRRYNLFAYRDGYLPGLYFSHLGVPFRKSDFEVVWSVLQTELDESCLHKFRTSYDLFHYVVTLWEVMQGDFVPVGVDYYGRKFGTLSKDLHEIDKAFASSKYKMICLNDSIDVTEQNFTNIKKNLDEILQRTFPNKSMFEL
ncbi:MAG: Stealth CR1 domain-containing protein [Clostridia bacterium]|nr:Stealth CR1 domain-containing protein [Clostridia bacterium]